MQKLLRTEGVGSVRTNHAVQFNELPSCADHTVEAISARGANTFEYPVSEMCHKWFMSFQYSDKCLMDLYY